MEYAGNVMAAREAQMPKAVGVLIPHKRTVFEAIDQQIAVHEEAISRLREQRNALASIGDVDVHTLRQTLNW